MKSVKIIVDSRLIICPLCSKTNDTLTGKGCSHLQKIIIRKNKEHIAIFK